MGEPSQVQVGLIDVEEEDAEGESKTYLTKLPRRCMERCCPKVVSWLEATGYDEALTVKDKTHMWLYLSCMVSFFFAAVSINAVVSFKCFEAEPGNSGDPVTDSGGIPECLLDVLCGLIFFGNLRDSVVMLANYDDDDHHVLLKKKKALMAELKTDIEVAYEKASVLANKLWGMLVRCIEHDFAGMITNSSKLFEDFNNILFKKSSQASVRSFDTQGSFVSQDSSRSVQTRRSDEEKDKQLLRDLVGFVGRLLAEPMHICATFCTSLEQKYKTKLSIKQNLMTHLDVFTDTLLLEEHLNQAQRERFTQAQRDKMREDVKHPKVLAQEIIQPVNIVAAYMMQLKTGADEIVSGGAREVDTVELMGFCRRPQWAGDRMDVPVRCCMPRLFALTLRRLCCFCFCWTDSLEKALKYYPPKRIRFFFVWFQIVSKLHERLIQGLFFSILLSILYGWRVYHTIHDGCQGNILSGIFWECAAEEFKKSAMFVALLFGYIPATFVCLLRIRDLDAIIRIMEDIQKLQRLRNIILDFEKTLLADERRQELLDKATIRVLARVKWFEDFRHKCLSRDRPQEPNLKRQYVRGRIKAVNNFFESAEVTLGDADKWLKVSQEKQEELIGEVNKKGSEMSKKVWTLDDADDSAHEDLEDGQRTPPFTPENSSASLPFVGGSAV